MTYGGRKANFGGTHAKRIQGPHEHCLVYSGLGSVRNSGPMTCDLLVPDATTCVGPETSIHGTQQNKEFGALHTYVLGAVIYEISVPTK